MGLPAISDTVIEQALEAMRADIAALSTFSGWSSGVDNWQEFDPDGMITLTADSGDWYNPNFADECRVRCAVWLRVQWADDEVWPWLRKALFVVKNAIAGKVFGDATGDNVTFFVDQGTEGSGGVTFELGGPFPRYSETGPEPVVTEYECVGVLRFDIVIPGAQ